MIKYLWLYQNLIGDEGASFVASSLSKVEQLHVTNCGFTEKEVEAFAVALKTITTKKLELTYQDPLKTLNHQITISCDKEILLKQTSYHRDHITGVGVELICEFLKYCEQLESLSFSYVSDENRAATAIAQLLRTIKQQKVKQLDFCRSDLTSESAKTLLESLLQDSLQQQVSHLCLSYTKIGDEGARFISTCSNKFVTLDLSNCGITTLGAKYLSDGLQPLTIPIKSLNLCSNCIGDEGSSFLASSLSKVERFMASYCGFTENGVEIFTDELRNTPTNQLGTKAFSLSYEDSRQTSHQISLQREIGRELDYDCADVTGAGVEIFCEVLKHWDNFNRFSVRNVKEGDRAAKAIAQCMHKFKCLEINSCYMTRFGIKALSDAIRGLPKHQMVDLSFYGIKVNNDGAEFLATCLSKIERLHILDSGITAEGAKLISDGLLQLTKPMEEIYLWNNDIGDIGAEALANSLHKIKRIGLSGCGITHIGIEDMSRAIEKLSQTIMFQVAENKIGFKGAKSLSKCVKNINFLNVFRCQLTEEGVRILRKAVDDSPGETTVTTWYQVA